MRPHGSICMTGLTLALQSRSDHLVECIFPLQVRLRLPVQEEQECG